MAEEFQDIAVSGDPVPKPKLADQHRVKLDSIVQKMIQNKEPDDNIRMVVDDFKQKYASDQVTQKQQPQQAAQPFKPMSNWLSIPQGYQPMDQANVVAIDDHTKKIAGASQRVQSHLMDIDNSVRNLIYDHKKELTGRIKSQQLGLSPSEAAPINPQAQQLESQLREDIPVAPEEVEEFKVGMNQSPVMLRQGLAQKVKDLIKIDPVQANTLKGDVYRLDRQANPEKEANISKNIEKINSGEYDYDVVNGRLTKPLGFFGSIANAFKEKGKAYDDYDVYRSGDEKKILDRINQRLTDDPDKAVPTPIGASGEAGAMLGGQPLKPLAAGAIAGYFTGGAGAAAAASAVSAPEMYRLTFGAMLPNNYASIKKQNPELSDSEALQRAINLTDDQANADALSGAAMGAIGARVALKPTTSLLLQKSVKSALKQIGETVAIDGIGGGAIGAGAQLVKNLMAQKAGIPVDESEGMAQQLVGGAVMTLGMAIAGKVGTLLKPSTYNKLLHGLSKLPEETIAGELARAQEVGAITAEEAYKVQLDINEQKKIDASIPENVPADDRVKVSSKIDQRNYLEKQLETLDSSFHPEIKEQIKALNEEIVNVSKGADRGDLQKLVDAEKKAGNVEGYVIDVLANASENDLKGYFREISEQAHDPNTEAATMGMFGEAIVNKAKELFPAPKESSVSVTYPKKSGSEATIDGVTVIKPEAEATKGISVIQPGEISRPETITIKPKAPGEAAGVPVAEEAAPPVPGEAGEPRMVGITHAEMNVIAEELGLPKYEGSPEKVSEWDQQAATKLANDPNALPDLFNKLRNAIPPDAVETRMMIQYFGDLMGKIDSNPYDTDLQNQLLRTKDLFNIAGRVQGKALVARKGLIPAEERLGDFILKDREANRAPLTEEQTRQSVAEFEAIKKAKDELDARVAKLEADNTKLKAQAAVDKIAKTAKKEGKRDFKAERDKVLADMKKKWDESKGQLSATIVPYADRLVKIAPDAAKLVRLLVEEGIDKLPDLVKAAHDHLKNFIPELQEKDVHDLIAGEYNKSKQSKNDIAEKLFDLRTEAKDINRLEALEAGIEPKNDKAKRKRNREIEELKERIREHDLTKLSVYKKRVQVDISKLEEQLRKGDYSAPVKSDFPLDDEAVALKDKLIALKQEREKRIAQLEYEDRTKVEKVKDVATNILNVPRTLMASADLSAPLRQGIVATVGHPVVASKAFVEMIKQAFSQKNFDRWLTELKESPEFKEMEDAGLYVADPNNLHLQAKEEQFMSNLGEKIPIVGKIVKGSERGYVAYLNKMRVDLYKQATGVFKDQGMTLENSPELYKGLTRFINNATGRGGLGPLERSAQVLNTAFFSPRLIASRLNMLNPVFYTKLPKEVRAMALKDMGKVVLLGASILGLAQAAGAEVEKDPRSSDFGKIKVGDTRWDIWGGFQQYTRIFAQLLDGKTKSSTSGKFYKLDGKSFPYKTRLDQLASFFRGKLAPVPGMGVDLLAGKNVVGEEIEPVKKAYELFVPMIFQDIQSAWGEQGFKSLLTVGVPTALGIGVTTYEKQAPKTKNIHSQSARKLRNNNPHKRD